MSSLSSDSPRILYVVNPAVTNIELNTLFVSAWPDHTDSDFQPVLRRSLAYIGAYMGNELVGFVNLAWDGNIHAFILDTTVHALYQRQGIGSQLLQHAIQVAHTRGIVWLHVDYEPQFEAFYRSNGFRSTLAGLLNVQERVTVGG